MMFNIGTTLPMEGRLQDVLHYNMKRWGGMYWTKQCRLYTGFKVQCGNWSFSFE